MTLNQTRRYLISKGWQINHAYPNLLDYGHTFCVNLPETASELHDGESESLRCGLAVKYAAMAEMRPTEEIVAEIDAIPKS